MLTQYIPQFKRIIMGEMTQCLILFFVRSRPIVHSLRIEFGYISWHDVIILFPINDAICCHNKGTSLPGGRGQRRHLWEDKEAPKFNSTTLPRVEASSSLSLTSSRKRLGDFTGSRSSDGDGSSIEHKISRAAGYADGHLRKPPVLGKTTPSVEPSK